MYFDPDKLIPDPKVWSFFGVTSMTGYRWTNDVTLEFPQPLKINGRNYRRGRELNEFINRRARESLAQRAKVA